MKKTCARLREVTRAHPNYTANGKECCAAVDHKMSTTSQGYLARGRKLNATNPIAFECFSFPLKINVILF